MESLIHRYFMKLFKTEKLEISVQGLPNVNGNFLTTDEAEVISVMPSREEIYRAVKSIK